MTTSERNITDYRGPLQEQGVLGKLHIPDAWQAPYSAPGRWSSILSSFENQWRECQGEPEGCRKSRLYSFKACEQTHVTPSLSIKTTAWKVLGPYEKIFEEFKGICWKGRDLIEFALGIDWDHCHLKIFLNLLSPSWPKYWWEPFLSLFIILVNTMHPPLEDLPFQTGYHPVLPRRQPYKVRASCKKSQTCITECICTIWIQAS